MPYLNLEVHFFSHVKTRRLVGLLGNGSDVLPIKLWAHVGDHHAKDGRLDGYTDREIEAIVGWWGETGRCIDAMLKVGFIHKTEAGFVVHDWLEHEGHIASYHERAKRANRKRWKRISRNPTRTPKTRISDPLQEDRLGMDRLGMGKEKRGESEGGVLPGWLDSATWAAFKQMRLKIRKPMTEHAEALMLSRLNDFREDGHDTTTILEQSIRNDWQDVYEPKTNNGRLTDKAEQMREKTRQALKQGLADD